MLFLKEKNIFITSGGDASIKFFAGIKGQKQLFMIH